MAFVTHSAPLRGAVSEQEALKEIYKLIRKEQKAADCSRAIMVAHNAAFDLGFVNAANERCKLKESLSIHLPLLIPQH